MYQRNLASKPESQLSSFKVNLKNSLRGLALLRSLPSLVFLNSIKYSQ
jgi:hypothetical protein